LQASIGLRFSGVAVVCGSPKRCFRLPRHLGTGQAARGSVASHLLARHPGGAGRGGGDDCGAGVRGEAGGGCCARERRRAWLGASAAAMPRPTAQALRTRRPRLIPLRGVAVAELVQVSKQVSAAREGRPAGGAAKRDRGAEARGAALVVKQAHVVAEVPLGLEDRAADLAVEGLGRGECGHVASSSRRLAASAAGPALESPRSHGRLT